MKEETWTSSLRKTEKIFNEAIHKLYSSPSTIRMT